jgi:chromosome segregation ATPase
VTDDASDDTSGDGKWLTYQQLAGVRHISKPSAIRLVMRHRWRRQRDNERVVRVLVPPDMLEPDRASYDASDDRSDDASDDTPSIAAGALAALEDAVQALRDQLERAETDRIEERRRADDLRAQIDVLNAEMVVMRTEADREVAKERLRADGLSEQVKALSAEVVRAEKQAEAVVGQAERAEAGRDAERARAEALRSTIEDLRTEQEVGARDLAVAQHDALAAQHAAAELRQAEAARKARGRLRRAWDGWRGR